MEARDSQRQQFDSNYRTLAHESAGVFTDILQRISEENRGINSRQIDCILVDINDTMSVTFRAMSTSLATEVVTRLEPLVEKHYQLNERLLKALEEIPLNRTDL